MLLFVAVTLLALVAGPARAGRARRCKRICRPLITACVDSQGCSSLSKPRDRQSCKRSCKGQFLGACRLDLNACATTTTTLPGPGSCPAFTATCRATTDNSGVTGLGNQACVEGQGPLPQDTTNVFISIEASDPTQATIDVNVTGSNFTSGVVCTGQAAFSNGTLTVEQSTGNPYGTAGCCTGDESSLLQCRVTITRLCAVNESIVGSFEADAQCTDGTTCSREVQFLVPRDS